MSKPWHDWIPGALSKRQLQKLRDSGSIIGAKNEKLFGHSSLDLTLSDEGYLMVKGAIKPQGSFLHFLDTERELAEPLQSINGLFKLNAKKTYVFKLEQRLNTNLKNGPIWGQATAKSSVGRLDVLARLIVDGMDRYEAFTPDKIGSGEMYVEITPLTFDVLVKPGISLSQLRLFYGDMANAIIRGKELYHSVLPDSDGDGFLTVELSELKVGGKAGVAFKTKSPANLEPVPLWKNDPRPDPKKYWELINADKLGSQKRLPISKEGFYILRSKQKIALTNSVCVYCRATDETIGEMRIHYAGFVHPFFGRDRSDGKIGTPLIFEVRGHDVEVVLNDGEKMAQLDFYRMSEDCKEEEGDKGDINLEAEKSAYGEQTLQLSNYFARWEP